MKHLLTIILFTLSLGSQAIAQPAEAKIDMTPWGDQVAVFTEGRVKSFETFARSYMQYISGTRLIDGQPATFTFFDMMVRPEWYANKPIIFVKNKNVRAIIVGEIDASQPETQEKLDFFMKKGLISREFLQLPSVHTKFQQLRRDVMRFASSIESIDTALGASDPRNMWANMQVVPPPNGSFDAPWTTLDTVQDRQIASSWKTMIEAWQNGDVKVVNAQLQTLASLIPALAGGSDIYPDSRRLRLESLYFKLGNLTGIWIVYLVAIVLLLMAFIYRFQRVGTVGLWLFVFAVALHTVAVGWRWYVSGRYPNTNMFESITTATWMGAVFAALMEFVIRKGSMKYLFALGASVAAMIALLAVRLYPLELNPHISNKMPVLHDIWLYIHVNFIIFSYCLIFAASVTASIYLVRRFIQKLKHENGTQDYARSGGFASLVEVRPSQKGTPNYNAGMVLDGATMVLVEICFILLWTGITMGAIWADHSWGRPWGWDPKEVFALNTFVIFAVLIHTRMKVKDKGLWTAILAIIGCAVMLFNWIIINFTISGLHSYA